MYRKTCTENGKKGREGARKRKGEEKMGEEGEREEEMKQAH